MPPTKCRVALNPPLAGKEEPNHTVHCPPRKVALAYHQRSACPEPDEGPRGAKPAPGGRLKTFNRAIILILCVGNKIYFEVGPPTQTGTGRLRAPIRPDKATGRLVKLAAVYTEDRCSRRLRCKLRARPLRKPNPLGRILRYRVSLKITLFIYLKILYYGQLIAQKTEYPL